MSQGFVRVIPDSQPALLSGGLEHGVDAEDRTQGDVRIATAGAGEPGEWFRMHAPGACGPMLMKTVVGRSSE
jgi:hypothetical protein